jgi:hypothetical protein
MMSSSNFPENSPASSGGGFSVNVERRVDAKGAKIIAGLRARKAADRRVLMKRKAAMEEGQWGQTTQIELEKTKLDRVQLGSNVYVTTESFYEYLIELATQSHPDDGPEPRVRQPPSMKRKRAAPPRQPSERELQALANANAQRPAEAQARRKADPANAG